MSRNLQIPLAIPPINFSNNKIENTGLSELPMTKITYSSSLFAPKNEKLLLSSSENTNGKLQTNMPN